MVETGCTKKAALDQLYGDGVNGLRYAFKNRVMSAETLNNYANRDPDVRPENYLNEDGFFPPAVTIHSEINHWEFFTELKITDGTPEGW